MKKKTDAEVIAEFNDFCHQHYGKIYPPLKRLFMQILKERPLPTTSGDEEIEQWVENLAKCRFTGERKTEHSEESYLAVLTIELAKILATKNQQIAAAYDKGLRKGMESSQAVLDEYEEDEIVDERNKALTTAITAVEGVGKN